MNRLFFIIGAGMGTLDTLTGEARRALDEADAVLATARLAALNAKAVICPFGELAARAVQAGGDTVAVLVSGDVGFFSAAARLREQLLSYGDVRLICGLSSLQYFCAKVGVPYDDACVRSLHGRAGSILGAVSYHKKVFALTGGVQNAQTVCRALVDAGLGSLTVHLGENLGVETERIVHGTAADLAARTCGDLAVLLIEHLDAVNAAEPLRDSMFTRAKVPMTKEEVRWTVCGRLAVQPRDTVWDVGAGTGAMTLELARRACDGLVYAVERNNEALSLLDENRRKLGGYNVQIVAGRAPEALEALPAPDCVFVGGSGGGMRRILALAKEKNPAVRVVVTAIALETLEEARHALLDLGFANIEVSQLAASRGKAVGPYTMLTALNPVFILSGGGDDAE
ncbi:precorrin-6y C5,15-methyltransferase (decarboxylating) subunit CbiE [Agathobaculum sp. Marseille-P7918]|uniref:precorrin-6y C5,15-methyltransferase (decarboxylating) subunit CbiE n=1 Tax=Agathobaculum sp. Marseille-P7918 TaxID=2479843 RepID=UPI000F640FF2|nr:precorrin-6y C5,15-methyltransferase (decarboxylating) subunit CbiE [Agathobaculum sp. Marseille-P7918]